MVSAPRFQYILPFCYNIHTLRGRNYWRTVRAEKRSGVAVPLFSFGELGDLPRLLDWCQKTGQTVLQLLPLLETGITGSPYDPVSSFALEPSYLSLRLVSGSGEEELGKSNLRRPKLKILAKIFSAGIDREGLENFRKANRYWVEDYALFKVLKDNFARKTWREWPEKFRDRDEKVLKSFAIEHKREIDFWIWVQWQLFLQLKTAGDYARKAGILLFGDAPLFVSADSADAWAHPEFFYRDTVSGAPPDLYSFRGQRWGMPPLNFASLARDDFRYFRQRYTCLAKFFDGVRLDHVIGFFRIWNIPVTEPEENGGLNGFFDPRNEDEWEPQGRKILSAILNSAKMFYWAEDLGVVPKGCRETLKKLGIPGTIVTRWKKNPFRHTFVRPENYPKLSVAQMSLHDLSGFPAFWEDEAGTVEEKTFKYHCEKAGLDFLALRPKLFTPGHPMNGRLRWRKNIKTPAKFLETLGLTGKEANDLLWIYQDTFREKERLWRYLGLAKKAGNRCSPEVLNRALAKSLAAKSLIVINTVFDWLALDQVLEKNPRRFRINTPGTVSAKNWSVKLPISLEDLQNLKINSRIREMVAASGRLIV